MKKLLFTLQTHDSSATPKAIELFKKIAVASLNQDIQIDFIIVGEDQLSFYKDSQLYGILEGTAVKVVFMPDGQYLNTDSKINYDLLDPILDATRYDRYVHISQSFQEDCIKIIKDFAFNEEKDLFSALAEDEVTEMPITELRAMRFYKYLTTKAKKVEFVVLEDNMSLHKVYGVGKTASVESFAKSLYSLRK